MIPIVCGDDNSQDDAYPRQNQLHYAQTWQRPQKLAQLSWLGVSLIRLAFLVEHR